MLTSNPSRLSGPSRQEALGRPRLAVRLEFLAVFAAFAALSARLLMLISHYAVNVFFMDQWEFNEATLFQKHSLWEMFRWQHGPHRQGLGAVLAFLVEPLFHWNSRTESFLVGGIVIVATASALWLKRRLFGPLSIYDVCIPLILLTPLQYETLFITANFAHGPLPLLLIILCCLASTVSNPVLRLALILLLNFFAIHTGFGFFLGLITPLTLALDYWSNLRHERRGGLLFLTALLLSVVSFAAFFVNYRLETSVDCAPNLFQSPLNYAQFLSLMYANVLGVKGTHFLPIALGMLILGAIVSALVVTLTTLRSRAAADRTKSPVIVTLLAFCLLFSANAAYGRSCLGVQVAQVSRYVIYMECGLLGLYFFLLTLPRSVFRRVLLVVFSASLLGTIPIRLNDRAVMNFISSAKSNWKACYMQFEEIRGCNHAVGYGVYPNTDRDLKGKLDFLKQTKQNLYAVH
jgi:hypothetical protein